MQLPELNGRIALDIETYDPKLKTHGPGDIRADGFIAGVALAQEHNQWSAYYPMRHEHGDNVVDEGQFYRWLRQQLNKPELEVVLTNAQYDLGWLAAYGVEVAGTLHDIQVAEPLLDENQLSYSLDAISHRRLGFGKPEDELYQWLADYCGGAPTRSKQGGNIWRAPGSVVATYAVGDVELPLRILRQQEQEMQAQGLDYVYGLEQRLIKPLLAMRRRGVRVNMAKTEQVAERLKAEENKARERLGIDTVWSALELAVLFDKANISYGRTPTGKPQFTAQWLEQRAQAGCTLSRDVLAVRQAEKARGTFVDGYVKGHAVHGRIHAQFHQMRGEQGGTVTGRFCIAAWTPIYTDKGETRIDQVKPKQTRVLSHTGRWNRVRSRIYKGEESMVRVFFADGSRVECTRNHRFWNGAGWTRAGNLTVGDKLPYVSSEAHSKQTRISAESVGRFSRPIETDHRTTSQADRKHIPQRGVRSEELHERGGIQRGEGAAILALEDGFKESDARETKARASQPSRTDATTGRLRERAEAGLDDVSSKPKQSSRTPGCDLRDFRVDRDSSGRSRSSHKRGAVRQRPKQPSASYERRPPQTPRTVAITAIDEVGVASVWDIEVERDHSYLACGVFHHNSSSNPNLQNIPARDPEMGPLIRGLFYPEEGEQWVSHDWSQVEYRLLTHYGQGASAEAAREAYKTDPTTDFHQFTAELTGLERKPAKNVNFGLVYGMGKKKLARDLGLPMEQAEEIFAIYHHKQAFVREFSRAANRAASQRGYVKTLSGRRRRFEYWEPKDWELASGVKPTTDKAEAKERAQQAAEALGKQPRLALKRAYTHKAANSIIQGGAADLMKKAIVDVWESGVCDELGPPLLTVHDELAWSRPCTSAGEQAIQHARQLMIDVWPALRVPLMVDEERGDNWGALEEM